MSETQKKIEKMLFQKGEIPESLKKCSKVKLLEICCFCILTYNIEQQYFDMILKSEDDVVNFFMSLTYIYDYKILYNFSSEPFKNNLLNWISLTASSLEHYLINIIKKNPITKKFLIRKWPDSSKCHFPKTFEYDPKTYSILYKLVSEDKVSINIEIDLDGAFLINNDPILKLPHELRTPYFEDYLRILILIFILHYQVLAGKQLIGFI